MKNKLDSYGYVLIDTDEKRRRFEPIRAGDRFLHTLSGTWKGTQSVGFSMGGATYLRPIDPGEGYEIVPLDGVSPCNTERTLDGVNWDKFYGMTPLKSVREALSDPCFGVNIAYRRKKSASLSVQMLTVAAKELLDRIAAGCGHYSIDDFKCNESRALAALIDWKSPKSADQIAFEKAKEDAMARTVSKDGFGASMWTAALKHARQ